jgi:hypothetical protein
LKSGVYILLSEWLETIEIPGRNEAYESIEEIFENLCSFKVGFTL